MQVQQTQRFDRQGRRHADCGLLALAAAAPDHGLLIPWRFIIASVAQRHRLAEVFALALIDRDPGATQEQIESAREKAHGAPLQVVAVACLGDREPNTPRCNAWYRWAQRSRTRC